MLFSYWRPCPGGPGICGCKTRERVLNHKDELSGNFSGRAANKTGNENRKKQEKNRKEKQKEKSRKDSNPLAGLGSGMFENRRSWH